MAETIWAWVIFPTLAKAQLARDELAGTREMEIMTPDGRVVVVPPVVMSEPMALSEGRAGYCCHYWGGNTGADEADEAIREQAQVLLRHPRYGATVTFSATSPAGWVETEVTG